MEKEYKEKLIECLNDKLNERGIDVQSKVSLKTIMYKSRWGKELECAEIVDCIIIVEEAISDTMDKEIKDINNLGGMFPIEDIEDYFSKERKDLKNVMLSLEKLLYEEMN